MPKPNPLHLLRFLAVGLLCLACRITAQESVYNGAFAGGTGSLANAITFETKTGKGLSIINIFRNWDDGNGSLGFPTATLSGHRNHGSMTLLSWQPQGAKADSHYKLANIINGNFDNFITNWALAAKAWGHPFFLRLAHEMNGDWYPWCEGANGNTSGQYVAAWRHIRDIFTRNGVTNVTWVWCPNTKYSGSTPISGLYPGDNYVDWISTDVYNRITNNWGHFSARGGPTLDEIIAIAPGKPVMIAETGCHDDDDKSGVAAGSKAQWYRTAMKDYLKNSMPRIKAWVYFNGNNPDGNDWRVDTSADVLAGYQESVGISYYSDNKYGAITESPIRPLLNDAKATDTMAPFVSIDVPRANLVQAGVVNEIRSSAFDKSGVSKVEFTVNGELKHTETRFPYQFFWQAPSGAGATHTIVCKAYDAAGNTSTSTIQALSVNPPPAPAGVAASDGTHTDKVRVTWNSVPSAFGYDIWRNTANNTTGAVKLNTDPVTATTYDDTTAPYTTTLYYWVRAVDDSGPGVFGAPDTGFRSLPPAPPAPTGLYATDGDHNLHTLLAWNNTAGATGYEAWRNTVNDSATAVKIASITQNSYQDTEVPYAVNHFYWVKAVNDGGTSAFSNVGAGYRGTLPTISDVTNRTINQNTDTGAIAFTIGDVHTPATELAMSATSSNTTLLPAENLTFGGSGANRSVTATPVPGQAGSTTVTLTVTDADGGRKSDAFLLTVNALPVISPLGDRAIAIDTATGDIPFTVSDAETAAASLSVTGASSNTALVPHHHIVFSGGGANRGITVTPAPGMTGTAEITVTAGDGLGSSSESFFLTVLDTSQALWTATATGTTLDWSDGSNWFGGLPPSGGSSTSLTFLSGSPLAQGTVVSHNNLAAPFALNSLTLSGAGPASQPGTVRITGGALRFLTSPGGSTPVIHLAADAGTGAGLAYQLSAPLVLDNALTLDGGGSADFSIDGPISGPQGITKTGAAKLALAGPNTYTGNTIVRSPAGSILEVRHPSGLGTGTLQVNTGAVSPVIRLHIDGSGNDGLIAMPNGFGGNSGITTTIDVANHGGGNTGNVIQLNGPSTGWGNSATLNVTGSNGYGLHIARLRSTGGSAGTETLNPTTAPLTLGEYQGANNPTTLALAGTHAANAITGPVVNGASVVTLTKSGGSTWLLGGANTFTGPVAIHGGTLSISHGSALGAVSAGTTVSSGGGRLGLRGGISVAEPVTLNGRSSGEHLVNESGDNTLGAQLTLATGGNAYFVRSDAGTLRFAAPVAMLGSTASKILHLGGSGNIEFSGGLGAESGTLGITMSGSGTLRLAGNPAFTGPTQINSGTLTVSGDLGNTASVTIADGATLTGDGTITAPATISGTHAPGVGIGGQVLSGPLSYESTSRIVWQLAGNTLDSAGFDSITAEDVTIATGARIDVVLDTNGSAVDFTDDFWNQPREWALLSASSISGSFAPGDIGSDISGRDPADYGAFALKRVGSSIHLVWTPDSPFFAWQRQHFGDDATDPDIAGGLADPDADGLDNLIEYALGTAPLGAGTSGITSRRVGADFVIRYSLSNNATDIDVRPHWSVDLVAWSDDGVSVEPVSNDGQTTTFEARVPIGENPAMSMRLRVTRP